MIVGDASDIALFKFCSNYFFVEEERKKYPKVSFTSLEFPF